MSVVCVEDFLLTLQHGGGKVWLQVANSNLKCDIQLFASTREHSLLDQTASVLVVRVKNSFLSIAFKILSFSSPQAAVAERSQFCMRPEGKQTQTLPLQGNDLAATVN